jgi:hypothetical protein
MAPSDIFGNGSLATEQQGSKHDVSFDCYAENDQGLPCPDKVFSYQKGKD